MDKRQELQSLKRGLRTVVLINTLGSITIAELSRRLRLPRTTAERVLMTLLAEGYIERDAETKVFFLTAQVHALSDGYAEDSALAAAARPILFETTRQIGWPLILTMPMGEYMSVRVTSDPETSLGLNRRHIGSALPMALGSGGLTFLAHLDDTQRDIMVDMLRRSDLNEQAVVHDPARFAYLMDKIRADGFGFGLDAGRERSVAVPVMLNGRVRASLLMAYMSRVLSVGQVTQEFVPKLRTMAAQIEQRAAASMARPPA